MFLKSIQKYFKNIKNIFFWNNNNIGNQLSAYEAVLLFRELDVILFLSILNPSMIQHGLQ